VHEELEKNKKISKDSTLRPQWMTSDQQKVNTTEFIEYKQPLSMI
jgi:hypothetical protein